MSTQGWITPPHVREKQRQAALRRSGTFEERYWAKVDKRGPDDCWLWTGSLHGDGYGLIWGGRKADRAHRVAWQLAGNELPPSTLRGPGRIVIDHTCRNRACQNTAHMRLTTQKRNTTENSNSVYAKNAQKTHCKRGHPLAGANLAIGPSSFWKSPERKSTTRICLTCWPNLWKYAVIERAPPKRSRLKWLGPFVPPEEKK